MATLAEFTVETILTGLNLLPKKIKNIFINWRWTQKHLFNKRLKI